MVDQVVYLPASQWSKVIDPTGDSKGSLIAKKVQDQLNIPYGLPVKEGAGIHGRVLEVITTPGRGGKTFLAIATFPVGVAGSTVVVPSPVHLVVIEKTDEIKEVTVTPEQLLVLQGKEDPLTKRRRLYNEILDSLFPGDYDWQGDNQRELIIRFPEITLSNSSGAQHEIVDLFVRMPFKSDLSRFTSTPSGRRMTVTVEELAVGYRHSHIPSYSNSWHSFCMGTTTFADKATDFIERDIDPDHFMVFMFQLKDYVAWESLEGGPHIRISNMSRTSAKGTTTQGSELGYVPMQFNPNIAYSTAVRVLNTLVPQDLVYDLLSTGERRWRLDTSSERILDLIRKSCPPDYLCNYDILTGSYIQERGSADLGSQRRSFLQQSMTFRGKEIKPKVLGMDAPAEEKLIKIPGPTTILSVVRIIDQLLNQKVDVFQSK